METTNPSSVNDNNTVDNTDGDNNVREPQDSGATMAITDDDENAKESDTNPKEEEGDEDSKSSSSTESDDDEDDDDIDDIVADSDNDLGIGDLDETTNNDEILVKATALKEEGNALFQEGDFLKASRSYRKAIRKALPLNTNNTGEEQVKGLLISCYNNLSMVSFKSNKYKISRDVATQSIKIILGSDHLQIDSNHQITLKETATTTIEDARLSKSFYRRGMANKKLGETDIAKNDLKLGLKFDPKNNTIKKELLTIKKEMEQSISKQKKNLQKMFSSGNNILYNDREEELQRKKQKQLEKEKKKEQEEKENKAKWEDECVKLMAGGNKDIPSYDDWNKKRIAKEKKEKKEKQKEEEKKQKELEDRRRQEMEERRRQSKKNNSNTNNESSHNDDDDKLTEEELKMFRGYKKTSDGRTTSYFTREQSEHEKSLIGDITPKRMDDTTSAAATTATATSPQQQQQQSSSPAESPTSATTPAPALTKGPSAWNVAGTWEEKDTTSWCKSHLESKLKETTIITGNYMALVQSIDSLTGDASVAITGSKKKKKYIFDFHCSLKFEIHSHTTTTNENEKEETKEKEDTMVADGKLQLPDICSTNDHDELEIFINGFKIKKGKKDKVDEASLQQCKNDFINEVRKSIKKWVDDFNHMY